MKNNFIEAIGNKSVKGFKAVFDIGNDQIAITPEYSKDILPYVIADYKKQYPHIKLIKIMEA
jgi:hypothetical protein